MSLALRACRCVGVRCPRTALGTHAHAGCSRRRASNLWQLMRPSKDYRVSGAPFCGPNGTTYTVNGQAFPRFPCRCARPPGRPPLVPVAECVAPAPPQVH